MRSNIMVFGGIAVLGLSLVLAACNNTTPPVDTGVVCPAIIKTTGALTYDPPTCTAKVGQQISIEASGFHPLLGVTGGGPLDTSNAATTAVTFTVNQTGKIEFFCKNHGTATSGMKGTITVTN